MSGVRSVAQSVKGFARRYRLPIVAGAVAAVMVASAATVWVVAAPRDARADGFDCTALEADDFSAANALAVACGSDVEVTSERTPWQTSWASASGAGRLEASATARRTLVDGEWVPIDSHVVAGNGSIGVAAPVFPMSLNPGGESGRGKPLGTIERDGHLFQVWFPLELPAATLDGSRVIYDFAGGVRLVVTINSETTGFIPVVELADPAASARFAGLLETARVAQSLPGAGMDLSYKVSVSDGLTVTVDDYSQLQATDAAGELQFFAPPPAMWDSSGATITLGPEVTEVAATDRTLQPSEGDHIARMTAALSGDTLVVTPDAALLSSADTVWPVYIDPSFSGYGASERIAVRTGGYSGTLYQWTDISATSPGEGTGYCSAVASCNTQFTQRLVWKFVGLSTIAGLTGSDIQSASFTVNGVHSYNCNAQTTWLWRTADISAASNWSLGWLQQLGSRTESQRPSCGTNGYRSFDATAGFVWAANADSSTISLGLVADESSMAGWKRFTNDATISVTYNRAPDAPTSPQLISPSVTSCVTGAGRPPIATTTPTLSAIVSDPEGTAVTAGFEIYPVPYSSRAKAVWSGTPGAAVTSGQRASAAVAAGKLVSGTAYTWRVRGYDGARYGAYSPWCEFVVDTVAPIAPTVVPVTTPDSNTLTVFQEGKQNSGLKLPGSFTLGRNSDTDVVLFRWDVNSALFGTALPDANGNATITFSPQTTGKKTLHVTAVDSAGNSSPVKNYIFDIMTPAEDGVWTLDEGTGVTAADTVGQPARPLTAFGPIWGTGPHELFGSRDGDHALVFDGVNDYAATDASVLDTRKSFAVSAHVLLDPNATAGQSMTVMSQTGVNKSGFQLGYTARCVNAAMTGGCWSFSMPDSVTLATEAAVQSSVPVKPGEWTHLVAEYSATSNQMRLWVCDIGTPASPAPGNPIVADGKRVTGLPWAATGPFELGRSLNNGVYSNYWDGSIDNVRVFSGQVVDEAKIRRLCQGAEATDFQQGTTALDPTAIGG